MGSSQKVASGVVWSTAMNVVNAVYGFISVPILIDYFGKAEYGIIGLAMSVNVYMQLMDMGFNTTNVRFYSAWLAKRDHGQVSRLFQTSLAFYGGVGVLNALVLLAVMCFTPQLFHLTAVQDEVLKDLLAVLAVSAVISWFSSCYDQLIRATENVAWIQRRGMLPKLAMIAILFVTVCFGLSIRWYFFLSTFAAFIIIPMSIRKICRELPFVSFWPKLDIPMLRSILPYCMNIFSFGLFQFSFYHLRPVFLGMQGTVESVADFRVLNGAIGVVSLFGSSFLGALMPSSAKAVAREDRDAYYRVAYDATKYISVTLCFCAFGMMAVAPEVLTLYVGESYLHLIPWFNLWLLCTLGVHNQAISSLILSGTDIRAISYNTAVSSVVGLAVAWFLIPVYQIGGVVIAFVVYCVLQLAFYYFYYWPRHMRIDSWRVFSRSFAPFALVGWGLAVAVGRYADSGLSALCSFFVKGVVFAVLYVLFVLAVSTKKDREFVTGFIRKKRK